MPPPTAPRATRAKWCSGHRVPSKAPRTAQIRSRARAGVHATDRGSKGNRGRTSRTNRPIEVGRSHWATPIPSTGKWARICTIPKRAIPSNRCPIPRPNAPHVYFARCTTAPKRVARVRWGQGLPVHKAAPNAPNRFGQIPAHNTAPKPKPKPKPIGFCRWIRGR